MSSRSLSKIRYLPSGARPLLYEKELKPYTVMDKRSGTVLFCAHFGTSMNPTLCELDVLEIRPYHNQMVRVGDVIVFVPPGWNRPAVHRVVRLTSKGIRTRGDNNNGMDPWIIRPKDIRGQVVRIVRGRKQRSIYGGTAGQLWSLGVRVFKVLEKSLSILYHRLAQSSLFRYLVPLQKRMRIIAVKSARGREFKLLLGRWVVGRYKPEMISWHIRRPFRLFVDERFLPR